MYGAVVRKSGLSRLDSELRCNGLEIRKRTNKAVHNGKIPLVEMQVGDQTIRCDRDATARVYASITTGWANRILQSSLRLTSNGSYRKAGILIPALLFLAPLDV